MRPIDADALIKRWDEMSVRGRTEFDQEIMVAPSIDIDRPQGEWIIEEFLWGGYVRMKKPKCSVCKIGIDHLATVLEDGSGWDMYKTADGSFRNLPRFCPNCGCRMKGADDERRLNKEV